MCLCHRQAAEQCKQSSNLNFVTGGQMCWALRSDGGVGGPKRGKWVFDLEVRSTSATHWCSAISLCRPLGKASQQLQRRGFSYRPPPQTPLRPSSPSCTANVIIVPLVCILCRHVTPLKRPDVWDNSLIL
jgi:hypothetical protein